MIDIQNLIVPEKQATVSFSGMPGFSIDVVYLGPEKLKKIQNDCTKVEFNRQTKMNENTLDEDKFAKEFSRAVIKGWKGLTLGYLQDLALIDPGTNPLDAEVEYTQANAEALMKNSAEFVRWVNEVAFELANFRTEPTPRVAPASKEVS